MAEDKQVSPSQFKGKAEENTEDCLRHFENYCAYRGLEEAKKLASFKGIDDRVGRRLASHAV